MSARAPQPGDRVICNYRMRDSKQPWLAPTHIGTVLALDDPRAWAGTLAFPTPDPDPAAVKAHVARHYAPGSVPAGARVPVLWSFGVHWDHDLVVLVPGVHCMECGNSKWDGYCYACDPRPPRPCSVCGEDEATARHQTPYCFDCATNDPGEVC